MGEVRIVVSVLLTLVLLCSCGKTTPEAAVALGPSQTPSAITPRIQANPRPFDTVKGLEAPPTSQRLRAKRLAPQAATRLNTAPVAPGTAGAPRSPAKAPERRVKKVPSAIPPPPSYPQARASAPPAFSLPEPEHRMTIQPRAGMGSYPQAKPEDSALQRAEAASQALNRQIQSGQLRAIFHGTEDPEEMVHVQLLNVSPRPVTIELACGMILNPASNQKVQPLLVVEDASLTLQPGESHGGTLLSYCMDSRVPAPAYGEPVDYRFTTRTSDGGPEAVRAYMKARKLAGSSPYAHAIAQIAIWKSLGQPVEDLHLYSLLGPSAEDPRIRETVLRDVDRVLRSL